MVERNIRTKRRTILYAVIAVFVLTAFSPGAAAASPDWPFPRGDLNNTGYSDLEGNFTEPVKTSLFMGEKSSIGDINNDSYNEIVTVYHNKTRALSGVNGSEIWNFTTSNDIATGPVLGDLNNDGVPDVAVATSSKLYVLNGKNGSIEWEEWENLDAWQLKIADINQDGENNLLASFSGKITAFYGQNGSILWSKSLNTYRSPYQGHSAISDIDNDGAKEVVVSEGLSLKVIKGENGSTEWSYDTTAFTPVITDIDDDQNKEIIFGSDDYYIYCLDGDSGNITWKARTPHQELDGNPVVADLNGDNISDIVLGPRQSPMYAIDGENGAKIWEGRSYMYDGKPIVFDYDGDGKNEVITGTEVLHGNNGSTFKEHPFGEGPKAVGDIDGDGEAEILTPLKVYGSTLNNTDPNLIRLDVGERVLLNSTGDFNWQLYLSQVDGDGDKVLMELRKNRSEIETFILSEREPYDYFDYSGEYAEKIVDFDLLKVDRGYTSNAVIYINHPDQFLTLAQLPKPNVTITSPSNLETFTDGSTIAFNASASAPNGSIVSYEWSSSKGGLFGTSKSLNYSDLSLGTHTITLTVTDNYGVSESDSLVLTVEKGENNATIDSFTSEKSTYSTGELAKFTVKTDVRYSGDYIVVVSGTESGTGDPVAGSSLLQNFQGTTTIPVYVSIPTNAGTGTYQMTAAVYDLDTSTGDVGDRIGVISPGQAIDVSVTK